MRIAGRFVFFLTVGFLLVATRPSGAETVELSYPKGFYLGGDAIANIPEADLRGDFAKVKPGGGLDLKIGYNFPINLALEMELGFSGHQVEKEDAGIGFLGFDLRYFPFSFSDRPLYPFIRFGAGWYALSINNFQDGLGRTGDLKLKGKGVDIGIGFDYYFDPHVSFEAGLTQRFVTYDDLDFLGASLTNDVKGHMTSLSVGAKYHF